MTNKTFAIESTKNFAYGVFVMILNTKTNKVNEMTFSDMEEANGYINAINNIGK
jgi:hypothetical protein